MPLILAIEPDRRQANQLTTMVRGRLHAELVLGDSAERALAALGQRIPDLILTSALLSPKDETALAERLRSLDGAAARVQTLTIPVLASPKARAVSTGRGMLAALRRDKSKYVALDGCDPGVFAEQCREYLERADADRVAQADEVAPMRAARVEHAAPSKPAAGALEAAPPFDPEPALEHAFSIEEDERTAPPTPSSRVEESPIVVPEPAIEVQPVAPPLPSEPPARTIRPVAEEPPSSLIAALEAFESEVAWEQPAASDARLAQPEAPASVVREPAEEPSIHPEPRAATRTLDFDLSALLDGVALDAAAAARPQDEPEIYEIDEAMLDEAAIGFEIDGAPVAAQPAARVASRDESAPEPRAFSETELYAPLPRPTSLWPVLDTPLAQLTTERAARSGGGGSTKSADEPSEWLDIIEAIRRDAEQARLTQPAAHSTDAPAKRRRRRRNMPIQDEWGLFDPSQCGFAALIAKLEEITDDDTPAPRRA